MKRTNPSFLCRLGLHKWKDYGELVLITWKEPGVVSVGYTVSKSKNVYTKRKCLRCGVSVERILVNNPDGTVSCVGWRPLSEEDKEDIQEEPKRQE